ncbi:MAG: hypothetical protein GX557_09480 [Chloroflexi bacterium]|nr:hypothetical protein [Chloroflexota bacterium]
MSCMPRPRTWVFVWLAVLLAMSALCGCNRLLDHLEGVLYPTDAPVTPTEASPEPSATATAAPDGPTLTPGPTYTPAVPPVPPTRTRPSATPAPTGGYAMIYTRGVALYRGDLVGANPVEAAIVPQLDTRAFRDGMLAISLGRAIELVDLNAGRTRSLQVRTPSDVEYAEVVWGTQGEALLHVAWLAVAGEGQGRAVEIHALSAKDGAWLGVIRMEVAAGLQVLGYDDAAGRVALITYDVDGAFDEVRYYSVATGALVDSVAVEGERTAVLSPDGTRLLSQVYAEGLSYLVVYDLQGTEAPQVLAQQGGYSVSHHWSPDGRYVAYLLRSGANEADPAAQGRGLWVFDTAAGESQQVIDDLSVASYLIGWTPGGAEIAGVHRGDAGESYAYLIRPDGGNRRILALGDGAEVIGWMSAPAGDVPQVLVDPWQARFVDAAGDAQATAGLVSEIVAVQSEVDDQALLKQIGGYLSDAGWDLAYGGPTLKRLGASTFVMQLPPLGIYVVEPQRAQAVASGHLVLDARLVGDDLGLVYGVLADGSVQPAFVLLRRQPEGLWQTLWWPQGQRDWIATDGEIVLAGEGLERLLVSGNSFGLEDAEDTAFGECRACPHRQFAAEWLRQGDAYVRASELPADAERSAVLWEITRPTPYGVLYECVRRLRAGLPTSELADPAVIQALQSAGLGDGSARLIAEDEGLDAVRVGVAGAEARYTAKVRDGRIVHFAADQ